MVQVVLKQIGMRRVRGIEGELDSCNTQGERVSIITKVET